MLDIDADAPPSGVIGRKLDVLVLSATELILPAATDDSVGVTDEFVESAKLALLLPDALLMYV
jgi:hypothetical protein